MSEMLAHDVVTRGTPSPRVPVVVGERCPCCGKWRNSAEFQRWPGNFNRCLECEASWDRLLADFLREPNFECPTCHADHRQMARVIGPTYQTALHIVDGKMGVMCLPCSDRYISSRRDRFGEMHQWWREKR